MRKTNLFKTIIFGTMTTLVIGTTVLAGTVEKTAATRGVSEYYDEYSGDVGHYSVTGKMSYTSLKIINNTGSTRLYYSVVKRFNQEISEYDLGETKAYTLAPGQNITQSIARDMSNTLYDYHHYAEGFNTTTSSVRMDYYSYFAQQ